MAKQVALKTSKNTTSVSAYIRSIEPLSLRKDGNVLLKLFKDTTGVAPRMWGSSIVGFGDYTYYRANGDEGETMATGFSLRKSGPTIYIMPGYQDYSAIIAGLGPHKLGKSCLYLKCLDGIDLKILKLLIRTGLDDLRKTHAVRMR